MGNIKNYCQQCQILSNIESLYKSLNVNSLTVNECFSAKSTKNSKSLSGHITITITCNESSYDSL